MPGEIRLTQGTRRCLVENVSPSGARVQTEAPLSKGAPVILDVAERQTFAVVVWVRDSWAGLRFDAGLPQDEMQRLLWITQNREQYDRECQTRAAREWSVGVVPSDPYRTDPMAAATQHPRTLPPIPR